MPGYTEQPDDSRPPLRIELVTTLQSTRECLRDEIEDDIGARSQPTSQIPRISG